MDTIFRMIFWIKGVWIEKHFLFGAFLGNLLMQQEAQAFYAKTPLAVLSANQSWMKLCMMFLECSDHDRIFEVELLEELSIFLPSRIYLANQDIFDAKTIFPSDREHKKDLKVGGRLHWISNGHCEKQGRHNMFGHLRFYYPPLQITVRRLCQAHAISKNGSVCENGSEASIFKYFVS